MNEESDFSGRVDTDSTSPFLPQYQDFVDEHPQAAACPSWTSLANPAEPLSYTSRAPSLSDSTPDGLFAMVARVQQQTAATEAERTALTKACDLLRENIAKQREEEASEASRVARLQSEWEHEAAEYHLEAALLAGLEGELEKQTLLLEEEKQLWARELDEYLTKREASSRYEDLRKEGASVSPLRKDLAGAAEETAVDTPPSPRLMEKGGEPFKAGEPPIQNSPASVLLADSPAEHTSAPLPAEPYTVPEVARLMRSLANKLVDFHKRTRHTELRNPSLAQYENDARESGTHSSVANEQASPYLTSPRLKRKRISFGEEPALETIVKVPATNLNRQPLPHRWSPIRGLTNTPRNFDGEGGEAENVEAPHADSFAAAYALPPHRAAVLRHVRGRYYGPLNDEQGLMCSHTIAAEACAGSVSAHDATTCVASPKDGKRADEQPMVGDVSCSPGSLAYAGADGGTKVPGGDLEERRRLSGNRGGACALPSAILTHIEESCLRSSESAARDASEPTGTTDAAAAVAPNPRLTDAQPSPSVTASGELSLALALRIAPAALCGRASRGKKTIFRL